MSIATRPTLDGHLLQVLITPEGQANPYPYYSLMREEARVSRTSFGPYCVNGYQECQNVLRDPRLGRGVGSKTPRWASSATTPAGAASSSTSASTTC